MATSWLARIPPSSRATAPIQPRVRDQVNALDELLTSILQAPLARTSLADNEDMRKISAYAGIIAVPTAIAGMYGMNFEHRL